jgi:hypothetical protein
LVAPVGEWKIDELFRDGGRSAQLLLLINPLLYATVLKKFVEAIRVVKTLVKWSFFAVVLALIATVVCLYAIERGSPRPRTETVFKPR